MNKTKKTILESFEGLSKSSMILMFKEALDALEYSTDQLIEAKKETSFLASATAYLLVLHENGQTRLPKDKFMESHNKLNRLLVETKDDFVELTVLNHDETKH